MHLIKKDLQLNEITEDTQGKLVAITPQRSIAKTTYVIVMRKFFREFLAVHVIVGVSKFYLHNVNLKEM